MTVNRVNLFEIIKTLYHNKTVLQKNSIYIDEFAQMLHRGQKDLKDDVMLLASLEYVKTDFIGDTVNQRLVLLTPKSMRVMDRTTPPRDYEEFIQMFENPEKDFADPIKVSDKTTGDKIEKGYRITKRVIGLIAGSLTIIAILIGLFGV